MELFRSWSCPGSVEGELLSGLRHYARRAGATDIALSRLIVDPGASGRSPVAWVRSYAMGDR